MKVFVTMRGEYHEGGGVLGIFSTFASAQECLVKDFYASVSFLDYREMEDKDNCIGVGKASHSCDWWQVAEWEVDGNCVHQYY